MYPMLRICRQGNFVKKRQQNIDIFAPLTFQRILAHPLPKVLFHLPVLSQSKFKSFTTFASAISNVATEISGIPLPPDACEPK